jgi:hypothetical protein
MTPEDKKQLQAFTPANKANLEIGLASTNDNRSKRFVSFCDQLVQMVPQVRIRKRDADETALPAIYAGGICYRAIPGGPELPPFLNLLENLNAEVPHILSSAVQSRLDQIKITTPLKIYITPHCPFCPKTVTDYTSLAVVSGFIKPTVIDGTLFPELAKADQIQSAPTVIVDDQFRFSGSVDVTEVLEIIVSRDPMALSADALRGMLEEGKANDVAELMLESKKIMPAFIELLASPKWPIRLSAMVVFETLAETDKILASDCITPLWRHFEQVDDKVKGDLLYIIGQTASKSAISKLQAVLAGTYSKEVKEAAIETLDELGILTKK